MLSLFQCMVFEHMAHGDLHEFLIFHSPKSDLNESEDSGEGRVLTQSEMSYIAIQIAAGEGEGEVKECKSGRERRGCVCVG